MLAVEDEQASYLFAGDRVALQLIFNRIDYATNGLIVGDYANAIENIKAVWERLPTRIKNKFPDPEEAIKIALERVPSEEDLWNDESFMAENPGWKDIGRYRYNLQRSIIYRMVHSFCDDFIRALDAAGIYIKEAGGGLETFGNYSDATKGMKFEGPNGEEATKTKRSKEK